MDIISHGLWGGVAFGRKNRKDFWIAFFFGIFPDLFSFGIYTAASILGLHPNRAQRFGQSRMSEIPQYVSSLYNVTHSLLIFAAVFAIVWLFRRRPYWLLAAWGLHILVDIPTHALTFFPTPFLWPVSNFHVNGISWGNPWIFFPNLALLILTYALWFAWENKKKKKAKLDQGL